MKLSVVIPAYNAENTLRKCVESVLLQGVGNMEIIIVDDGSADRTAMIANGLGAIHGNIKIIHQNNQGLSSARNSGIEAAAGELITFVDSDDRVKEGTYARLMEIFDSRPDCDVLEYSLIRSDGKKEFSPVVLDNAAFTDSRKYWFRSRAYNHAYAWNKIFRRRIFFNGKLPPLRFETGRVFEDIYFLTGLLNRNPVIITASLVGYVYTENRNGITARASAADYSQLMSVHLHIMDSVLPAGKLSVEEEEYYMAVANIQITLCRLSGQAPQLPSRHVSVRCKDFFRIPTLLKKIMLNIFGIDVLCKVFSAFHRE